MTTSDFEYTIERKRAGLTSIRISVTQKGVVVRAPFYVPEFAVRQYVKSQQKWIETKLATFARHKAKDSDFKSGSDYLYLGLKFKLIVHEDHLHIPKLVFDGKLFNIYLPPILSGEARKIKINALFDNFYKREAEKLVTKKAREYASVLGVRVGAVRVKTVSSIWGSCSGLNNLSFNVALVRSPLPVLEYVVAHEVAHIIHKNHSRQFWNTVARLCPSYKIHVSWLRRHGQYVME